MTHSIVVLLHRKPLLLRLTNQLLSAHKGGGACINASVAA